MSILSDTVQIKNSSYLWATKAIVTDLKSLIEVKFIALEKWPHWGEIVEKNLNYKIFKIRAVVGYPDKIIRFTKSVFLTTKNY